MKRNVFLILLGVLFCLLLTLVLSVEKLPSLFSSFLAFPFEQVGIGLRALSRAGNIGNGLALAICTGLSLLPALYALGRRGVRTRIGETVVLCCMSLILIPVLWFMTNPTQLFTVSAHVTDEFLPVAKGILGCTVWSFAVLWLVLRWLRMFRQGDTAQLLRYLRTALYALCLLFDAGIALSCGKQLIGDLSSAQQPMDSAMAILHFLAAALPYLLDIVITLTAITLLDAWIAENQADTVRHADMLSRRCRLALGLTAASTVVLNVAQILLARWLSDVSVRVEIPVVSLAFLLLILIAARMIAENRKLRDDNALFI